MINIKLRKVQIVVGIIVIVVGFFFINCTGPQKLQFKSCEENAGIETECRTFEISGEASILPF